MGDRLRFDQPLLATKDFPGVHRELCEKFDADVIGTDAMQAFELSCAAHGDRYRQANWQLMVAPVQAMPPPNAPPPPGLPKPPPPPPLAAAADVDALRTMIFDM